MLKRAACAVALMLVASTAFAANVDIGDKAPGFEGKSTNGKALQLSDFDGDVVVVCFTCNSCPVAVAYEDRFINFQKKYDGKVDFVAVNVNPETLAKMQQRSEEKGFNFPYLKDDSGDSARAYGAQVTPHIFVLDKDRTVQYIGAFDDNTNESKAKKQYVQQAVDALLAGKKPETQKTRPVGCGIKAVRR